MNKRFQRLQKQFKQRFLRTKRHRRYWLYGLGVTLITLLCLSLWHNHATAQADHLKVIKQLQTKETQRQSLTAALQALQKQKADTDAQLQAKAASEAGLQRQIEDLNAQLQTKREQQSLLARASQAILPKASAETSGCVTGYSTSNYALNQIMAHEGGGYSCATNPGGCFGLLQACPGAPLRVACGGNPDCQISWFIANKTGGRSWEQIWSLWQTQHWW